MNELLSIKEKIRAYILQSTYEENGSITDGSLIFKEGYFDSMGFIALISYLEKEFNIVVEDKDLVEEKFESIYAISDFIEQKIKLTTPSG